MLFDDEKDYNLEDGNELEINDDGTVTWEDVLNADDDDILIPNEAEHKPAARQVESSTAQTANKNIDMDLLSDDGLDDEDDDVSDDELARILNGSNAGDEVVDDDVDIPNHRRTTQADYNVDSQLANIVLDDTEDDSNMRRQPDDQPAKHEYHLHENAGARTTQPNLQGQQRMGELKKVLLVFIALVVVLSVYFYVKSSTGSNIATGDLKRANTQQENLDNLSEDDIASRNQEDIPIVNEEEVDSIQPDEIEKKETIEVAPTGRANPFLPLAKYVAVTASQPEIVYSDNIVPAPPAYYGEPDERIEKMIKIAVSGIMYDSQKPSAILTYDNNDYFVQKGDKLDDYKVTDITKTYVILALGRNTYKATVGEEFKISQDFSGSATYNKDGRQYQSVEYDRIRQQNLEDSRNMRYNPQNYTKYSNMSGSAAAAKMQYVSESDVSVSAK